MADQEEVVGEDDGDDDDKDDDVSDDEYGDDEGEKNPSLMAPPCLMPLPPALIFIFMAPNRVRVAIGDV